MGIFDKNRDRENEYTFANINLLGKCNCDCFFCLGKDIEDELNKYDQTKAHFDKWLNFEHPHKNYLRSFIQTCQNYNIKKIYITGQNTDSLLYYYLYELIDRLHFYGFQVGLRTNGFLALQKMDCINKCELSTGYSIHTLDSTVQKMILGSTKVPNWAKIINLTERPRVQVVVNRCNLDEFFDIIRFCSQFGHLRYVQARRVSTDTRQKLLEPDAKAYEQLYTYVSKTFPLVRTLWGDAEEYYIYGVPVCFWRTVKTTVNSVNYFTNGVLNENYFVVEGYMNNKEKI